MIGDIHREAAALCDAHYLSSFDACGRSGFMITSRFSCRVVHVAAAAR